MNGHMCYWQLQRRFIPSQCFAFIDERSMR